MAPPKKLKKRKKSHYTLTIYAPRSKLAVKLTKKNLIHLKEIIQLTAFVQNVTINFKVDKVY